MTDARVEPDRRLVQEQHLRVRDEGARDLEPAALATAVGRDGALQELGEAERVGELGDAPGGGARLDTPEAGVDVEVAPPAERAIDGAVLEDDAAGAPGGERIGRDVGAGDARAAARGRDRGREHADGRGLAGAVGPVVGFTVVHERIVAIDIVTDPDKLHVPSVT